MRSSGIKLRMKALLIDYLCIVLFLLILFIVAIFIYYLFLNGIPEYSEAESQWIALITSVLPVSIYFAIRESRKSYASIGKKKTGIKVVYLRNPVTGSIIRNVLKFLPWQLAHLAVIRGMYYGFDSYFVMMLYGASLIFPAIYIGMVIVRKDHRHIPDILAKSYVVVNKNQE